MRDNEVNADDVKVDDMVDDNDMEDDDIEVDDTVDNIDNIDDDVGSCNNESEDNIECDDEFKTRQRHDARH